MFLHPDMMLWKMKNLVAGFVISRYALTCNVSRDTSFTSKAESSKM